MELTRLTMTFHHSLDSSIIMIGEFVLDHQLVIKNVCLCKSGYGRYYLRFPESEHQRCIHPIDKQFYEYLLAKVLADYNKQRSIVGRIEHGKAQNKAL